MKKLLILTVSALLLSAVSYAKTPALTTPKMTDQEYAQALGFTLLSDEKNSDSPTKNSDLTTESTEADTQKEIPSPEPSVNALPAIKKKDLAYRCDISLAQPFAVENQQQIELAIGVGEKDDAMVIKIKNTPLQMKRTHYEPEHLHIWSNLDQALIMTLDVEEVYKDKFVSLQSGTLTVLTPKLKEQYKAVLTCRP